MITPLKDIDKALLEYETGNKQAALNQARHISRDEIFYYLRHVKGWKEKKAHELTMKLKGLA